MTLSSNLPLFVVSSFEREWRPGDINYLVLFEGKSQVSRAHPDVWQLTIRRSKQDKEKSAKYIFQKDGPHWVKAIGINNLPEDTERAFIPWAVAILAPPQPPET